MKRADDLKSWVYVSTASASAVALFSCPQWRGVLDINNSSLALPSIEDLQLAMPIVRPAEEKSAPHWKSTQPAAPPGLVDTFSRMTVARPTPEDKKILTSSIGFLAHNLVPGNRMVMTEAMYVIMDDENEPALRKATAEVLRGYAAKEVAGHHSQRSKNQSIATLGALVNSRQSSSQQNRIPTSLVGLFEQTMYNTKF